jgi:hypothetical protein
MADVTDITGIGPAKAETLEEEGYGSLEDIANADADALSDIDGVGTDDRALEFIVEAEDLLDEDDSEEAEESEKEDEFDLTPSEVADEIEVEEVEEESEPEADSGTEADSESESTEPESSGPPYEVEISFDEDDSYHTFHAAIMRYHEDVYTSHQPAADTMRYILDELDGMDSVTYELDEDGLNTLHTAVKQTRTNYQGDNLISHMEALQYVEEQINEKRRAELF